MNMITPQARVAGPSVGLMANDAALDGADAASVLRRYLRIAQRWRYVILGVTVGCLLLGLVATLLMTPKYTATTLIEIQREANQVTNFQGVERETGIADQSTLVVKLIFDFSQLASDIGVSGRQPTNEGEDP